MQLRGRSPLYYSDSGPILDAQHFHLPSPPPKPIRQRASFHVKDPVLPTFSDEIEHSAADASDDSEKPEAISDDSSNLDGELPVANKITRRVREKLLNLKRSYGGRVRHHDNDDFAQNGMTRPKKAAPKDLLLKFLRPNVSNVEDRPSAFIAGSDSDDDAFEAAPPSLQAGRRKRKVVAQPRRSSVLVSSDDDEGRSFKKNPADSRKDLLVARASTRAARQNIVSYKEPSSDEELGEPASLVLESPEQPERSPEAKDEIVKDASARDFTEIEGFAFKQGEDLDSGQPGTQEEDAGSRGVKCYLRKNRVQSKMQGNAAPLSGPEDLGNAGLRRSERRTRAANLKDGNISDEDGNKADVPIIQRSLRDIQVRNLKDASSSDGAEIEAECPVATRRVHFAPEKMPQKEKEVSKPSNEYCSEKDLSLKQPVMEPTKIERPTILNVGVYGLQREEEGNPLALTKRIGRVEKILSVRRSSGDSTTIFCVKENGRSYRNVVNVSEQTLLKHCPQLLRNFSKRMAQLGRVDGHCLERADSPAFDPLYTQIDRIISHDLESKKKIYLVKWCRLPYSEATWEKEEHLLSDRSAISRYYQINKRCSHVGTYGKSIQKIFRDGRTLRDYQEAGVTWLYHNFENRTNCVLADEMGLGKTIQSVAMLETLRFKRFIRGPFLVIAPVSTLGHWQREIESLTDMNCVVYSGSQEDRDLTRQYEFHFSDRSKVLKFNVLLTSFEILMKDQNKFSKETWQYIIVDEAHRLKSKESKTTQSLRQLHSRKGGLLLLTGTPVQNNTKEIFSLLNLLDPERFNSEEKFLEKYGEIKDAEQIKDLQDNILRPRLLRRMKEDVEKSIPQKEETIVWVELTKDQRAFYKGIFENNISSLLKGSSSNNLPNLRNVAMELRKVCNHPFLCDGLESNLLVKHESRNGPNISGNLLQSSSGKMILVDKLLPKLKDAGRRVLIFSQFTIMLDLLEDYMTMKQYSYERIDGRIRGSERQAAIDRYSAKDSNIFVFLLSTRAGGLGITLTAADTCIIYDSDWNPQNDLQAMARCHRIGQTKDVKIYRLITRNTYEQRLFECSSRKYGLDEAILGNRLGADANLDHDKSIESLLKHGAYDMMKDDGEKEAAEFTAQDIDQILKQRTQQRQIGGIEAHCGRRANNTFSVATFKTNPDAESEWAQEGNLNPQQDSTDFWQGLMPEACERAVAEALAAEAPVVPPPCGGLRKRTRARVNYRENAQSLGESSTDEREETKKCKKSGRQQDVRDSSELDDLGADENSINHWSQKELKRLEDRLFALGRGRTEQIREEAQLGHRSLEEIDDVSETLIGLCQSYVDANEASAAAAEAVDVAEFPVSAESGRRVHLQSPSGRDMLVETILSLDQEARGKETASRNKPLVLPVVVQKVLESQACKERIKRNAQRYVQQLHERKVLAEGLQMRAFDFMHMPFRSKKLPSWWGQQEDRDLLRAADMYGHKDYKRIKSDSSLSFVKHFASSTGQSVEQEECGDEEQTKSMPTDQVLGSRLRVLIEALPNGLSAWALKKRASKTSRKLKAENRKFEETNKPRPIMDDKNLAEWVTSSSMRMSKPTEDEEVKKELQPIVDDKNSAEWLTSSSMRICKTTKDEEVKNRIVQSFETQEERLAKILPFDPSKLSPPGRSRWRIFVNKEPTTQQVDIASNQKKPLSQNNQRNLDTRRSDVVDKMFSAPENLASKLQQKRQKVLQENVVPKRGKLSLSQNAAKNTLQTGTQARQLSLKSFMKSLPMP